MSVKLTKSQQQTVKALQDGCILQVVLGAGNGQVSSAVMSPKDSNLNRKDSRRYYVNAQGVNKLLQLGILKIKSIDGVVPLYFAEIKP